MSDRPPNTFAAPAPIPTGEPPAGTRHPLRAVYSPSEAAAEVGVSRSFLYAEMTAGRLRTRKAGRRRLIAGTDLAAWLDSLPVG